MIRLRLPPDCLRCSGAVVAASSPILVAVVWFVVRQEEGYIVAAQQVTGTTALLETGVRAGKKVKCRQLRATLHYLTSPIEALVAFAAGDGFVAVVVACVDVATVRRQRYHAQAAPPAGRAVEPFPFQTCCHCCRCRCQRDSVGKKQQ